MHAQPRRLFLTLEVGELGLDGTEFGQEFTMSGVDAGLFFLQRSNLAGDRLEVCVLEVVLQRFQRFSRAAETLELVQGGAGVAVEFCPLFCLPRSLAELIDVAGAAAAEQPLKFTLRRLKFAFASF